MDKFATLKIDLAKSAVQLHGGDAEGRVLLRRQLRHRQILEFAQQIAQHLMTTDFTKHYCM
ncbi:MAG: hypothetical protein ACXIUW_16930 [Roseinatronobacter sp.]